jgi:hypothetical protein
MMSMYCFGLEVLARLRAVVSRESFDRPPVTTLMLAGAHCCQEAIDLDF